MESMGPDATADDGANPPPAGFTGRRVAWRGPAQTGVAAAYWAASDAGDRLPQPEETTRLVTGEHGTVGELTGVSEVGHWYVVRFDGGHELETVLPAPDLVELDPPRPEPRQSRARAPRTKRYAPTRAGGLAQLWHRVRQHGT